ncbi:hypothetical protein PR202_gb02630 [Eleusine coracana subsp. coracana]|uniref:CREG-like beta-barrel domain-containing protein n=1 Tax=Eleusine coracana subsp. coracana TaxID=191504 RepID=A0AAV5DZV6_ELECO|nr:hypothetical protein PR202_gb02630 [Eleusine coracana subsp. coracana]
MEALAGTASSSLLPAQHPRSCLAPQSLAFRLRPCGPLRAAAAGAGGGKEEVQTGVAANGSPVLKSKNELSPNGALGPIIADKAQKESPTNASADSSGSRAGLFRTPISGGVQSATFAHGLPPPALAVRNLMEQARFAHLCSVMSGMHHRRTGYPFGSLVDFANDSMGHPIFSLSPLAIHTRNLLADPRCTLVVQVPGWSGLSNARVTIFGDVYPLPADQQSFILMVITCNHQEWAHKQYVAKHQQWASQQWGNFYYYRMHNIRFDLNLPDYFLLSFHELNAIFSKPLREFLSSEGEVDDAALISVDSKGIDIRVRQGAQFNIQRLAFDVPHKVETLEEAKRALHKLIKTNNK